MQLLIKSSLPFPRPPFTAIAKHGRTNNLEFMMKSFIPANKKNDQIFSLPKDTFLYPAHDYKGFSVTTVGEEMLYNPRLTKDEETFKNIMQNLKLAYPKMIDVAVPSNMVCGLQDVELKAEA